MTSLSHGNLLLQLAPSSAFPQESAGSLASSSSSLTGRTPPSSLSARLSTISHIRSASNGALSSSILPPSCIHALQAPVCRPLSSAPTASSHESPAPIAHRHLGTSTHLVPPYASNSIAQALVDSWTVGSSARRDAAASPLLRMANVSFSQSTREGGESDVPSPYGHLKERTSKVFSGLRRASAALAISTAVAISGVDVAHALDQLPVSPSPVEFSAPAALAMPMLLLEGANDLDLDASRLISTPVAKAVPVSMQSATSSPSRSVSPEAQEEARALLARQLEVKEMLRNEEERICDAVLSPVMQGKFASDTNNNTAAVRRTITWADCAGEFPADVMVPLSLSHGDGGSSSSSRTISAEPALYVGPVGAGAASVTTAVGSAAAPITATEVSFAGAAAATISLESAAAAALVAAPAGLSAKLATVMAQSAQHFGVGGVAGAVGAAAVYPLDTIKTRMQAQRKIKKGDEEADAASGESRQYRDEWDCFTRMVREEGPGALYSGLGAQLVGIAPEKAIKLTVNELLLTFLESSIPGARLWALEIIAGGGGGFCQVVFTNPVEIVKVRMQARARTQAAPTRSNSSSGSSSGSSESGSLQVAHAGEAGACAAPAEERAAAGAFVQGKTSWQVVRELGLRGLYSGSTVTLARDVPSTALFFACYAALKQVMPDQTFLDGCLAAVPAAYLVTPMDVVKTRMQMEPEVGKPMPSDGWQCARQIVEEEGAGALFKGGVARVLRMSPQFGITLMLYDLLLQ